MTAPAVSFVVPAKDEAATLPATLASVRDQRTDRDYEVIVVDGDSDDATPAVARRYDATVVSQDEAADGGPDSAARERVGPDIGDARHRGARRAAGDWLAFVDADTAVRPDYLDSMLAFASESDLAAASSRCRVTGPARAKAMEAVINHVFPRLDRPVLPGFNCFVRRDAYFAAGGFPNVPNEDTAFSRELGRERATGYHPDVLVETSGRRIRESGLTGTLYHYLRLDWHRIRSEY
ncbi:glycosyltransferase [Halorussus gelatinilyticus]|uniref:Glycosyltransferase n=1 Tax=Halorussus gelatinilyticus TaxID=2937524 RepID=A0A8U0IKY4_9EURY|nr:glycosyltransferase [Halorussus gelatinilyticus]UPW00864.1 glycosyltransferase [Halorussus gelatinilyticus]